jgi:hypothetical protein
LGDEASVFEDVEVLKDGGHGDGVGARKFSDRCRAALEGAEDAAASGVAEGTEGGIERAGILNHSVK